MKGSSISRAESSDDVTLDFFRLKWRSWSRLVIFFLYCLKINGKKIWNEILFWVGGVCMCTLSPASTRICMLVWLLTAAFWPPLLGVGGRSRQLGGGSLGSGGGLAVAFPLKTHTYTHTGSYKKDHNTINIIVFPVHKCEFARITGLSWWPVADSCWQGHGTAVGDPGQSCPHWQADPRSLDAAQQSPDYTPSGWMKTRGPLLGKLNGVVFMRVYTVFSNLHWSYMFQRATSLLLFLKIS